MRSGLRRSGDPTTSPRSASLDDTYLSSPLKRSLGKTHSRMAVRFSVTSRQAEQYFESADLIVIRSHSGIQLCTYTVFPATHAKFLLQENKYTEEEYDMNSREESSTMENVQNDIQCL